MRHIAMLHFSARSGGNCAAIAQQLSTLHPDDEITIYPVAELEIAPCRGCQYQCFVKPDDCPHIHDDLPGLYQRLIQADLVYFILPNYAGAPPALYYAFNERSQCVFQGDEPLLNTYLAVPKRFIFVSNGLCTALDELPMYHITEGIAAHTLYLAPRRYSPSSIDGTMMDSPAAQAALAQFVAECEKHAAL